MSEHLLDHANPHFVDRVMALADEGEVEVAEDIFTDTGVKLLAKGVKLTRSFQDRLLMHKLQRPLVQSLSVSDGITVDALMLLATMLVDEQPILARLVDKQGVAMLAQHLRNVRLDRVSLLLLTLAHRTEGAAMRHAVLVTLTALALAERLSLPEPDQINLATAALLHDIGELYIDPVVLSGGHLVTPDEWRALAVHPVVGRKLVADTTGLGPAVARLIGEHHERIDGSGYPRGLSGDEISPAGQLLAAAEMTTGLLGKASDTQARLDLALKVMSSGHAPEVMSCLRKALAGQAPSAGLALYTVSSVLTAVNRLVWSLDAVRAAISRAEVDADNLESRELVAEVESRFNGLHRAFLRTGLGSVPVSEISSALFDAAADELTESMGIIDEINWRLRELARFAALRIGLLKPVERHGLDSLLAAIADPLRQSHPA
ncbi:HD-GYP domain-containing protein [Chitinimonas sp. BJYL2]|uniref:HD-GYP domain-containing protein n=1 Tax=Chitinimonas sp. BJYL2 TaxID=2976696 RepID=UPI0022B359F9|nr:HD domain-containing phosphohydrolase [Chitinimonas sp. BJYL2]